MKKVSMVLMITLTSLTIYSCSNTSATPNSKSETTKVEEVKKEQITLAHQYDEIEGKDYYGISKPLILMQGKEGFNINIFAKKIKGKIVYSGLALNVQNVGSCHEEDILYVLFEDGTKEQFKQWNNFNCTGDVYLDLYHTQLEKFNKPIKGFKLVNGRTYDSYEKMLDNDDDKNWFVNVINAFKEQNIVEVKELPTY
jgi:hypothetical protein